MKAGNPGHARISIQSSIILLPFEPSTEASELNRLGGEARSPTQSLGNLCLLPFSGSEADVGGEGAESSGLDFGKELLQSISPTRARPNDAI